MVLTFEAFSVNLVNILRPRRADSDPAIFDHNFQTTNIRIIPGCFGKFCLNLFSRQLVCFYHLGSQFIKDRFLFPGGFSLKAAVISAAKFFLNLGIYYSRVLTRHSQHFCSQQVQDDPIFIGCPGVAVLAQERSSSALFAAKAKFPVQQPRHKPLETNRDLCNRPVEEFRHSV